MVLSPKGTFKHSSAVCHCSLNLPSELFIIAVVAVVAVVAVAFIFTYGCLCCAVREKGLLESRGT